MKTFYLFLYYFFLELAQTFESCSRIGLRATFKAQFVQTAHSDGDQTAAAPLDPASAGASSDCSD